MKTLNEDNFNANTGNVLVQFENSMIPGRLSLGRNLFHNNDLGCRVWGEYDV